MRELFEPRSVAVVGASATPGAPGHRVLQNLRGYAGRVLPINPRREEIAGLRCYPTVAGAPERPDLALILLPAERVLESVKDCAAAGLPYAVICASGFGEVGGQGAAIEREVLSVARAHGLRLIGPNCIGLVSAPAGLVAGFSPLMGRVRFEPGNLGLVAQSGALGYGIASLALERGLGFSRIINTGNEADLTSAELVLALLDDRATGAVLVYSEGIRDALRWREVGARAHATGKPVIVLKAGRSEAGRRAAASHTAALTGDDAVWEAAFAHLGLLRVSDVDEMLDLAAAFAQERRPAGGRVGVLTTSGGAGILAADAAPEHGLTVPPASPETRAQLERIIPAFGSAANPVDVTAQVIQDRALFRQALGAVARDPGLDLVLACFCVLQGEEAERIAADLVAVHQETARPVLVARTGAEGLAPGIARRLQAAGLPVFATPARAMRAAGALLAHAAGRPPAAASALPAPDGQPGDLTGLPYVSQAVAETEVAAVAAAELFGYPVVIKLAGVAHKTDLGGVRLGLGDAAAVRRAFAEIGGGPVLVQPQIAGAVAEILLGVTTSPIGPVVTVGLGGVLAELLGDVARRLAPVTEDEAAAMLAELKGYRLLCGFRGRPAADVAALCRLISDLSQRVLSWPGGWELDLNPVLVLPSGHGAVIVDSLFQRTEEAGPC